MSFHDGFLNKEMKITMLIQKITKLK